MSTGTGHCPQLAPYPDPLLKILDRACPTCGKRTLTIDYARRHRGQSRLLCCSCGAWGSSWFDEYSAPHDKAAGWTGAPEERAWLSLQNYGKRVADELIKDP